MNTFKKSIFQTLDAFKRRKNTEATKKIKKGYDQHHILEQRTPCCFTSKLYSSKPIFNVKKSSTCMRVHAFGNGVTNPIIIVLRTKVLHLLITYSAYAKKHYEESFDYSCQANYPRHTNKQNNTKNILHTRKIHTHNSTQFCTLKY